MNLKLFFLLEPKIRDAVCGVVLGALALLIVTANGSAAAAEDRLSAHESGAYAGFFAGSGRVDNRLIDPTGFANWGNPGSVSRHEDSGFVGGLLIGKKFDLGNMSVRVELDGIIGDLESETNQLDPEGLDETAVAEFQWITTARVGIEKSIGSVTVFVTGGLALARIENSVTDIDFGADRPPAVDPDDSFRDRSTETGWVVGFGAEVPLTGAWTMRFEGLHLDFGRSGHHANHSGNNSCGPGGPREPCPYRVENELDVFRLAITHPLGG